MKAFIALLFFISITLSAQSSRFLFEYRFAPDSTKIDSTITQMMRLNVNSDFSEFISNERAQRDSIVKKNISLNKEFDFSFSTNPLSSESIVDLKTNKTYVFAQIGIQDYKVNIQSQPKWQLSDETKTLGNYTCQKATAFFYGRNWEAWFTTEIPLQEGPFVFRGLPGLIIELQDSNNTHHFKLMGISNPTIIEPDWFAFGKIFDIEEKDFTKHWLKFKENPIPPFKQMESRGIFFADNADFNKINSNHLEEMKKEIKANNNPILLDLYR